MCDEGNATKEHATLSALCRAQCLCTASLGRVFVWMVTIRSIQWDVRAGRERVEVQDAAFFVGMATRAQSLHDAANGPIFCSSYATLHENGAQWQALPSGTNGQAILYLHG